MRRLAAVTVFLAVSACGPGINSPQVTDLRVGEPSGPNAALYLTALGNGTPDRLVGASTPVAARVEIHETMTSEDGTMGMRPVPGLELPADGTLVLEPGGPHLMLVDVDRLEIGDAVIVNLRWENAGEMTVEADVVAPGETVEDSG